MNGSENLAFVKDDRKSDVAAVKDDKTVTENEIELGVESLTSGNDENQTRKKDEDIDIVSRVVVGVRSHIYELFKKNQKCTKSLFYISIHAVLISYLIAATSVYFNKDTGTEFWRGYGLLLVLYCLLYGGLIYYFVIKRYFSDVIKRALSKPKVILNRLWMIRVFRWACILTPVLMLTLYIVFETSVHPKKLISYFGILTFIAFGFIFSESPGNIKWRPVYTGLILQFVFGFLALKWNVGREVLRFLGDQVAVFLGYTSFGTNFVYGPLVGDKFKKEFDTIFAFEVLSVIFFFAFFVSILSYYNILQWFVLKLAWVVQAVMGTTVCESVNATASIFLGLTESVLLFKHQLKDLTRSELHAILCEGLSTVAGTVMAAYISFGVSPSHLIAASVMSAPAALSYAKLFYPEKEESKTTVKNIVLSREEAHNVLDAACKGAITAIALVSGIIANIIAFLAFIGFLDGILNWFGILLGFPELTFQYLLTKMFIPISFLMGVDDNSIEDVALLVGTKTFVNEFRAYELMRDMKHRFTPRTEAIATYALCGFSNFGSIGIIVGGISGLEPSKTADTTAVAFRAFIAANIVCFITACVAGTLVDV